MLALFLKHPQQLLIFHFLQLRGDDCLGFVVGLVGFLALQSRGKINRSKALCCRLLGKACLFQGALPSVGTHLGRRCLEMQALAFTGLSVVKILAT